MSRAEDTVAVRTDEAVANAGLADPRPAYRALLVRLRELDPPAFEEATERYERTVATAIADGADPLAAWVAYGAWIAARLAPGRLVSLDETGLATDLPGEPVLGEHRVLLHLPDARNEPAIPIARPCEPSPAQQSALELLVR